jgi:DNA-binding transcriptional LysR family regulator
MCVVYEWELRHLAALATVADTLHFGRAAARLHVAQPALSRTIQQLEKLVGVRLLERTTRSVSLTPAGAELAERATAILADCDAAAAVVDDIARGRIGRLRVAFSGASLLQALPDLLRRFSTDRPGWRVEVTELSTSQQIRRLLDRALDVGFFLAGPRLPAEIQTASVAEERACIGLPAGHPLSSRATLRFSDLRGERLILFPRHRNPTLYDEIFDLASDHGRVDVEIEEASSRQVAAGLVAAGLGVATFTEGMAAMCGPNVKLIPQEPTRTVTVLMGWHRESANPLVGLSYPVEDTLVETR